MSALSTLRVVDLAGPAGAYGTKLLADLGAEVVKVEPPGGDAMRFLPPQVLGAAEPENGLWWAWFAAGKKSVVIDPGDGATLDRLIAGADVVVDTTGADHQRHLAANPALVWAAITPYGLTGPKRGWTATNLTAWAASSVLYTTGMPETPPVVPGGKAMLACHTAALNAAVGALVALRARRLTGRGQLVDISMVDTAVAVAVETSALVYLDDLVHRARVGNRRPITRPWGLYPATDGFASIVIVQPAHWKAISAWLHEETGNEAVLDPVFADMRTRWEAADAIDLWTEELTANYSKRELFLEGQRRGIPVTPVNTVADLNADPHLEAAGFFAPLSHPTLGPLRMPAAAVRLGTGPRATPRLAPSLGEHSAEILGR
jgi:crotonobetainyl-CoA:carnitine CoA-transferase CaiB-like acyl-CoA transferase